MLFRETVAVYCENHTERTDTLRKQITDVYNMSLGGKYGDHCALNGLVTGVTFDARTRRN
jgi:hypothetical protein